MECLTKMSIMTHMIFMSRILSELIIGAILNGLSFKHIESTFILCYRWSKFVASIGCKIQAQFSIQVSNFKHLFRIWSSTFLNQKMPELFSALRCLLFLTIVYVSAFHWNMDDYGLKKGIDLCSQLLLMILFCRLFSTYSNL